MRNSKPRSPALAIPLRRRERWACSGAFFHNRPLLEVMEDRTLLTAFLVTNTDDSGPGSIRQAILNANASSAAGNAIDFVIPGEFVHVIEPLSPLPAITRSVLIDGTSQPGYAGVPLIELNGTLTAGGNGLTITGPGSTVRSLAIDGFASGAAILIQGDRASQNAIYGNQLGTNALGTGAGGNLHGIEVLNGAHDNEIGSNSPGRANTIAGNTGTGVLLNGAAVDASHGFASAGNSLVLNGSALIQGTQLVLADSPSSATASAFTSRAVDVTRFNTDFSFQLARYSDCLTFTIEGLGPAALGGKFGYEGLENSVSVTFCSSETLQGSITTGMFVDGADPRSVGSINVYGYGISLGGSDVFQAALNYDGAGLSVTITDTATGATATQVYSVDIPGTVGGSKAYVGFTAGTDEPGSFPPPVPAILAWSYAPASGVTGNKVAGNSITNNGGAGIAIVGARSTGNALSANIVYGNAGPAIDDGALPATGDPLPAPTIIETNSGGLRGWLHGGLPESMYHIEIYASAAYAADGSGDSQDYLGSLDARTDGNGNAAFDVPLAPPDDLPVVTATATDPWGNTSAISGMRTGGIAAPAGGFRFSSGLAMSFGGTGAGLALEDPAAGPLDSTWTVTVSVPAGVLSFEPGATTAGVATVQVEGTLPVINAVLAHLYFTPPPGFHGDTTLVVSAASQGAVPLQSVINITDGVFVVSNPGDSGPGTLRQAITDSNAAGGSNTIAFALPGAGLQTIVLASPLPAASSPTLIDGATQPGFSGLPLVALTLGWDGARGAINVLDSSLAVRSLAIDGFVFGSDGLSEGLTIASAPCAAGRGGEHRFRRVVYHRSGECGAPSGARSVAGVAVPDITARFPEKRDR